MNRGRTFVGLILLTVLGIGCTPAPTPAPPASPPKPAAEAATATVVYLDGTVTAETNGASQELDVGSVVSVGTIIKTGPQSVAELAVGTLATLRLRENTVVKWEALLLDPQKRRSQIELIQGEILNKVSKLTGADSYTVRTNVSALGVRGTQFLVRRLQSSTTLAVKEGTVAVLPPSYNPSAWQEQYADKPETSTTLEQGLLASSQGVTAGQKVVVDPTTLAAQDQLIRNVGQPGGPSPERVLTDLANQAPVLKPQALTADDQKSLAPLDAMPAPDAVNVSLPAENPPPTPTAPPTGPKIRTLKLVPAGAATATSGLLVVSDGQGSLKAYDTDGRLRWTAPVPAVSNPQAVPVIEGSEVLWTGDGQLAVLDVKTGKLKASMVLDANTGGAFGKRALAVGNRLYLGASDGLAVFDRSTGSRLETWPFAEGTDMTPAQNAGQILVVGRSGTVFAFAASGPPAVLSAPTAAVQPTTTAVVADANRLLFADRKGTVWAVNRKSGAVEWSVAVPGGVFDQPTLASGRLSVYAQDSLVTLQAATGKPAFAPLTGLVAPPLVTADSLWLGRHSEVARADAATGAVLWTYTVPSPLAATPVVWDGEIAFPLTDGTTLVVDPKSLR